MTTLKVHFVHVGNMNNKGTQALFKSDFNTIKEITNKETFVSVSTTDIEGVKRLNLPMNAVLPPMVDIPYDKADQLIRKFGVTREDIRYKVYVLALLGYMFLQIPLTLLSIFFMKLGLKAFYRSSVLKCIKNCDLVISHSDENFKETASLLPLNPSWVITWWSMLISRTCEVLVARSFGKPVVMFPNSVGPFRTKMGELLVKLSLNLCDRVLIRDSISYKIVTQLGIRALKTLTYDTALLFSSEKENLEHGFTRPLLGVCPGIYSNSLSGKQVDNYIMAHAGALDAVIDKYGLQVVFIPHYISGFSGDDLDVSKQILQKMRNQKFAKIVNISAVDEFKAYLDQMDMIISSKMHPAVLGVSGFVPLLCILYDHKQTSFFDRLGMIDCTLSLHAVSEKNLFDKIVYVWSKRDQLRESLKKQIPIWQKHVYTAIAKTVEATSKQS